MEHKSNQNRWKMVSVAISKQMSEHVAVCFVFSSGLTKNITIRNNVAVVNNSNQDVCSITAFTDEVELKKVLTGLSNPVTSIASGDIQIVGDTVEFLQFFSKFR